MRLTSPVFQHTEELPARYTCDGEDKSPPLRIADVPAGVRSLALVVHDPDAPHGDWVHWTVWNIPPETQEIIEGKAPADAVEGMTDFGRSGYGGPCPPSGVHRYVFSAYALDTTLPLDRRATRQDLEREMNDHVLTSAELIGRYTREGNR